MKKIVIIGGGQVGTALAGGLGEFEVVRWTGDLDALTTSELQTIRPDAVINAAGKTDLAWCEANAGEAMRSNLEAPVQLYRRILALNSGIRFLHFSSGCIWDGPFDAEGKPFTPDSPANPACLYSWTKAAADALLLEQSKEQIAILRPRQVYSEILSPRNTLSKLLRYPGLIDTPNSMSSAAIILKTVKYLLTAQSNWTGVWNVYDEGYTTPYHVGVMLAEAGLRERPTPIEKSSLDTWHKPKRVDAVLFDERFEATIKPEPVEIELQRAIVGYKAALAKAI